MNKLSQECKEVLEMMEIVFYHPELGYNNVLTTSESTINEKQRKSFGEGLEIALINPTIYQSAGLMSVEEALRFMRFSREKAMGVTNEEKFLYQGKFVTTTELLNIFRQQIKKNDT
jgi:hypothetical protein